MENEYEKISRSRCLTNSNAYACLDENTLVGYTADSDDIYLMPEDEKPENKYLDIIDAPPKLTTSYSFDTGNMIEFRYKYCI